MTRSNGNTKSKRQQAILALVPRERLGSQEEIRARLASMGISATQSTISRDIEEQRAETKRLDEAATVRWRVERGAV